MFKPGQVAPVGEGFRIYKNVNGNSEFQSLYTGDKSHTTLKGSYLAACSHFSTMFGVSCSGNSYTAGKSLQNMSSICSNVDYVVIYRIGIRNCK